jgi:hypothetical protein
MKKTTIAALGTILIALLVVPKFVGNKISESLSSTISIIDKNPVYHAKIITESSTWFSSQAIIEIGIDIVQPGVQYIDSAALTFQVAISAQHGPIIICGDSPGLQWASWQATISADSLRETLIFAEDKAFYEAKGQLDLLGTTHYQDIMQAFTYAGEGLLTRAEFSGLQGVGAISKDHYIYSSKIAEISLENAEFTNKMQALYLNIDAQTNLQAILQGNLYNGSSSVGLGSFEVVDVADSASTTISKLDLSTLSNVDDKNNMGNFQIVISSAAYQSPSTTGRDFAMTIELNHISAKFLNAYQTFYSQIIEQDPEHVIELTQEFIQGNLLEYR